MVTKESSDELNPTQIASAAAVPAPRPVRSPKDYLALAIATCGVGYIPLAPGTWGSIVVDKNNMPVPREMMEGGEKTFLGMEPVALVILVFMLCFIAFIAWQISQMPVE